MPDSRPKGGFGGRGGSEPYSRERKFGAGRPAGGGFGGNRGGFGDSRPAFGDRQSNGPRVVGGFAQRDERPAAPREGFSYERKGGFNDRFAGDRHPGGAPRGDFAPRADFAPRKPAFGKPAFSKPAGGGKVFVPRDAQKRFSKNER